MRKTHPEDLKHKFLATPVCLSWQLKMCIVNAFQEFQGDAIDLKDIIHFITKKKMFKLNFPPIAVVL